MIKNYYFEYKQWSIFWGLFLDQQKEVQKVIDRFNKDDWKVVQFQWNSTKEGLFKNIIVIAITLLSFGFISYWVGFSIIFESNTSNSNVTSIQRTGKQKVDIREVTKPRSNSSPSVNTENLFD